jgi:multicomponent Na+:H+ antiporter subunit B
MSPIVRTVARLVTGFITMYGIYVVLYGHVSPGGGFAGGAILAAGFILLLLAFGKVRTEQIVSHRMAIAWDSGGALAFLAVAALGYVAGSFFLNFLALGEPYRLVSAGTLPLSNASIGAKVGAGLFGVFLALSVFRPAGDREDET